MKGVKYYLGVEQKRDVFDVEQVVAHTFEHLVDIGGIAVFDHSPRGDAGAHLVEDDVGGVARHDGVDEKLALGPWSDERHVAAKHVPELWELVEAVFTQEGAEGRDAAVAVDGKERLAVGLGVDTHGPELVDVERTAASSEAALNVDGGGACRQTDGD